MKLLRQSLNTKDDSFTYTVTDDPTTVYRVDNNATLYKNGKQIGSYKLARDHWQLWLDGELIDSSEPKTIFGLPEFELASLTRLVNKD